jgi:hypothetical protein
MFTEEQRAIFQYSDGAKSVYGDPLAIARQLTIELKGELAQVLKDAYADSPPPGASPDWMAPPAEALVAAHAMGRFLAAVRAAFRMAPLDLEKGTGATDRDCLAAYDSWASWCDQKKTTTEPSPSSQAPTPPLYHQ